MSIEPVVSASYVLQKYLKWSKEELSRIEENISTTPFDAKIVFWGASFQTERLLGNINIGARKIIGIIDNSEEKKNLKLSYYGEQINVYRPSTFDFSLADYIIISTYNNYEPIYKQISDMGYAHKVLKIFN